jgi:hypothetical protein
LISIFYHPCEWVHQEFWDGVNFRRGANPPREQWKPPPQRPAEETEAAFGRFAEYVDYIRALPGVRFVTAGDLPNLYPDLTRNQGVGQPEIVQLADYLAGNGVNSIDYRVIGPRAFSPADQFELLTIAMSEWITGHRPSFPLVLGGLLGPESVPGALPERDSYISWPAFRDAVLDTRQFIQVHHRVPSRVFIGADAVAPADFLIALGSACKFYLLHGKLPTQAGVPLGEGAGLATTVHIAPDTEGLYGGWIIHKAKFRAPKIVEMARLQAWTLKPALPKKT